jgi:hypothetical protein
MQIMKPYLCKAGVQLREQIDDCFPDRDRKSDGWIGDARHASRNKSDHNPDAKTAVVRAIDVDKDLNKNPNVAFDLFDQLRNYAELDRKKRISYLIFNGKICSAKSRWKFVAYKGLNPHQHHIHISFSPSGDSDNSFFDIPLLGGKI